MVDLSLAIEATLIINPDFSSQRMLAVSWVFSFLTRTEPSFLSCTVAAGLPSAGVSGWIVWNQKNSMQCGQDAEQTLGWPQEHLSRS